jgi:hypothetical protein
MPHAILYALVSSAVLAQAPAPGTEPAARDAPPATESPSDLRKENDRLRQRVQTLEGDLQAAIERIRQLEAQLAAPAQQAPPVAPAGGATPVPANPAIGPGGLLSALRADYYSAESGLAGREVPGGPGTDAESRKAWAAYQRAVEPWIQRENRKATEVQWTGTVDHATIAQRGREVSFVVVFTNGGKDYRAPIVVDSGMADRLKGPDGTITRGPVVVQAVVTPRLVLNPNRPDPGAFDNPPLVAPFVEFAYDLKVRVVLPAEKAKSLPAAP